MSGVTGVFLDPLRGAQQEGVGGFFKGVATGLTGVVLRPLSGALDAGNTLAEGVGGTIDSISGSEKKAGKGEEGEEESTMSGVADAREGFMDGVTGDFIQPLRGTNPNPNPNHDRRLYGPFERGSEEWGRGVCERSLQRGDRLDPETDQRRLNLIQTQTLIGLILSLAAS